MGISALFVIILLISIFLVSYIPNLTFRKKVVIVIAAILVCFLVLAIVFATQFGSRRPNDPNENLEIKK